MSTSDPILIRSCSRCGKPEHGSIGCEWATPWPTPGGLPAATVPDMVWRTQISGALVDITATLLALTEVVQKIAEKLDASNQEKKPDS